jgi:peptide/nickel transport system permease protein
VLAKDAMQRLQLSDLRPVASLVLRRIVAAIPVVIGVSLLTFFILDLLPGNAALSLLGADATPQQVAQLQAQLGLDRPAGERYLEWMGRAVRGDLGRSMASGRPMVGAIAERLPVTLELVSLALALAVSFAVGFALIAARNPGGLLDRATAAISMISLSMPSYLLAPILVLLFAMNLNVFRSIGFVPLSEDLLGNLASLTLPAIALACPFFGLYARFLRGDIVEQLQGQGYIVTARAKGLGPWSLLLRHALRNSVFGLITLVGLNLAALIGGSVVVEQIFALPGMGQLLLQAINTRDAVAVQAIVLLTAVVAVVATLCVDLLYLFLDPRVGNESS